MEVETARSNRFGLLRRTLIQASKNCIRAALLAVLLAHQAIAATYDYSNTTPVAIPDPTTNGVCSNPVTSVMTIPDSYVISDLDVGFVISHSYPSDLNATLTSPMGTEVSLLNYVTPSDGEDGFNVRLDNEAPSYRLWR